MGNASIAAALILRAIAPRKKTRAQEKERVAFASISATRALAVLVRIVDSRTNCHKQMNPVSSKHKPSMIIDSSADDDGQVRTIVVTPTLGKCCIVCAG